jgi:hypothetical protein
LSQQTARPHIRLFEGIPVLLFTGKKNVVKQSSPACRFACCRS